MHKIIYDEDVSKDVIEWVQTTLNNTQQYGIKYELDNIRDNLHRMGYFITPFLFGYKITKYKD